jgi:hypothetical protein
MVLQATLCWPSEVPSTGCTAHPSTSSMPQNFVAAADKQHRPYCPALWTAGMSGARPGFELALVGFLLSQQVLQYGFPSEDVAPGKMAEVARRAQELFLRGPLPPVTGGGPCEPCWHPGPMARWVGVAALALHMAAFAWLQGWMLSPHAANTSMDAPLVVSNLAWHCGMSVIFAATMIPVPQCGLHFHPQLGIESEGSSAQAQLPPVVAGPCIP